MATMQAASRQRLSSVYVGASVTEHLVDVGSDVCPHLRRLHDTERALIYALAAARESIAQCEQALARLVASRSRCIQTELPAGNLALTAAGACPTCVNQCDRSLYRASPAASNRNGLTARELQILRLIAIGMSNRVIAQDLFLSPRTIERHITNIYLKIGAHNKAEATAYALRQRLA
jgi:DNA-binding NarL/FixJ family response regulator